MAMLLKGGRRNAGQDREQLQPQALIRAQPQLKCQHRRPLQYCGQTPYHRLPGLLRRGKGLHTLLRHWIRTILKSYA
jgi:hypothetical protein